MDKEDFKLNKLSELTKMYISFLDDELSRIQFLCKDYKPEEIAKEIQNLRSKIR